VPSTDAERAMFDFVDAYDRVYETAATRQGLSVAQACVLGRLADPRGMRELADELGCDASNITQIIARLESRDPVQRHTNPHHRRSRHIVRTPAGDALYADFEATFAFARGAVANLSTEEQDQLATLLRKALATADRTGAPASPDP
jgi:DNA-binding MarR family transcriptional regulator